MKRDMDLIRTILLKVEEGEHGFFRSELSIEGHSEEKIGYHAYLIVKSGLAAGADVTTLGSSSPEARITNLTPKGHDFLDAAREPSRWKKVREKVGDATIKVYYEVLKEAAKRAAFDAMGFCD